MEGLLIGLQNAFKTYPVQTIGLAIFFPLMVSLIYNHFHFKKNQLSAQLKTILNRENEKGIVDNTVDSVSSYLGDKGDKIQLKLERSNIRFKKREYLALMVGGVVGGFLIGFVLFPFSPVFMAVFGWMNVWFVQVFFARLVAGAAIACAGYFVPELWIQYLIMQRTKLMNEQIEDAILNMADILRSGGSIHESIRVTGEEMNYPMGDEFARAYEEMRAGKTINVALEDLKKRVQIKDFGMAMDAVQIQFETGAPLEPLLRDMVKVIGERKILKKEITKAVTESKTTGVVLLVAPVLFSALFSNMNSESYTAMLHSQLGLILMGIAVGSYILGAVIIFGFLKEISKIA